MKCKICNVRVADNVEIHNHYTPNQGEKCFNCGEYTAYKTGLGDYACLKCGIYSADNKTPYGEENESEII